MKNKPIVQVLLHNGSILTHRYNASGDTSVSLYEKIARTTAIMENGVAYMLTLSKNQKSSWQYIK